MPPTIATGNCESPTLLAMRHKHDSSAEGSGIKVLRKNTHALQAQLIPRPQIAINTIALLYELHTVILEASNCRKHRAKNTRIHCVTDESLRIQTHPTIYAYTTSPSQKKQNNENETKIGKGEKEFLF